MKTFKQTLEESKLQNNEELVEAGNLKKELKALDDNIFEAVRQAYFETDAGVTHMVEALNDSMPLSPALKDELKLYISIQKQVRKSDLGKWV